MSIDEDKDKLKDHVVTNGWTKLEHFWVNESDCSNQYSVKRVPNVILIDQNGKIVFRGSPSKR